MDQQVQEDLEVLVSVDLVSHGMCWSRRGLFPDRGLVLGSVHWLVLGDLGAQEVPEGLSLLVDLVDHGVLLVLGFPWIQGLQLGLSPQYLLWVHWGLATHEFLASHLCQESHLSRFHPEDPQVPARQELLEQAKLPSVRRILVQ